MRSATSYFNGTLYRKTLTRFWPLWGSWLVLWLFALPLNLLNTFLNYTRYMEPAATDWMVQRAQNIPNTLTLGLTLVVPFAVLCAMAVFGYLYNSRSACWTHALPMRREALFTTQYLAGLSFLLLPQLAAAVLAAIVEVAFLPMESWGTALGALLTWLLAQSGFVLFFFSFAAFCAMFTGHILALPAFYGILNVLAWAIYYLIDALLSTFYYGYCGFDGALTVVEYLTPYTALRYAADWWEDGTSALHLDSPGTIAVYALVGVVLAVASLYVYRRRHVETAGDVVAVPLVRPLFKYGVAFCAGLSFGMFTSAFFGWDDTLALTVCILLWEVVGYFVAEMLLKKSFRVLKAWKGAAVMTAVMLVLCLGCFFDLLGVVERVPNLAQVESLHVFVDMNYPYDSGQNLSADLTDPGQIQKFLDLHQAIVDNRDQDRYNGWTEEHDYISVNLSYTLSGGQKLDRRYHNVYVAMEDLNTEGSTAQAAQAILDDRELVGMAYDLDHFLDNCRLTGARLDNVYDLNSRDNSSETVYLDGFEQELWDAVQQDFAEGTLGQRYLFMANSRDRFYECRLRFEATLIHRPSGEEGSVAVRAPGSEPMDSSLGISLTPQAKHTLAVLEKTRIFEDGYALVPYSYDYDPSHTSMG